MAIKRINRRVWVILVLVGFLTGSVTFSAFADTSNWIWRTTAPLNPLQYTATPLNDGRVLVVGGLIKMDYTDPYTYTIYKLLDNTALYSPADNKWTPGPLIPVQQFPDPVKKINKNGVNFQTATLLQDGRVLVAGGQSMVSHPDQKTVTTDSVNQCWLFDPANAQAGWQPTGSLTTARDSHSATLITAGAAAGKVLVLGGEQQVGTSLKIALTACELYDPAGDSGRGSWTSAGELNPPRNNYMGPSFTATALPNGKVLVAGGLLPGDATVYPIIMPKAIADCELYDASTNSWSPAAPLNYARAGASATLLSDDPQNPNYGKVLVAGGNTGPLDKGTILRNYEIYDMGNNTWTCPTDSNPNKHLLIPSAGHPATLLKDGTVVLVAAGNPYVCQLYTPDPKGAGGAGDAWTTPANLYLNNPRGGGQAVTRLNNDDGWVLVTGGGPNQCELFQPQPQTLPAGVSAPMKWLMPGK